MCTFGLIVCKCANMTWPIKIFLTKSTVGVKNVILTTLFVKKYLHVFQQLRNQRYVLGFLLSIQNLREQIWFRSYVPILHGKFCFFF